MYNPCFNCLNRYGHSYTEECDTTCAYARDLAKLKPYGTIDEIVEILKGNVFPVVFVDKDHIEFTERMVAAAKAGYLIMRPDRPEDWEPKESPLHTGEHSQ